MKRSWLAVAALALAVVLLVSPGCRAPNGTPDDGPEPQEKAHLQWSTFLGGNAADYVRDIAVDANGNIYVVGTSEAAWGNPLNPYGGGKSDAFVAKFDAGGEMQWHTFLGGNSYDEGEDIVLDNNGHTYIVGTSYSTWGDPLNPYRGPYSNVFVAKLDENGGLAWHTFSGLTNIERGNSIALDGQGNLYVTGMHGFAAKLDGHGAWRWRRSVGEELGMSIAVDGQDNVYTAGTTSHLDLDVWETNAVFKFDANGNGRLLWRPDDEGTNLDSIAADDRGFVYVARDYGDVVTKLDSRGELQWEKSLGKNGGSAASAAMGGKIAYVNIIKRRDANIVVKNGRIFDVGSSGKAWGKPLNPLAGGMDAFVGVLNASGVLQWNTFLGGTGHDYGQGIALDSDGNIYVAGYSDSPWGSPLNPHHGGFDGFVAKLSGFDPDRVVPHDEK